MALHFKYSGTNKLALREHDGEPCLVVRPLELAEADAEVGTMYLVRFADGFEADVFEDELVSA